MKLFVVLLTLMLTGCHGLVEGFNDIAYELGGYGNQAPTLSGTPNYKPDCYDNKCRTLYATEAKGYELARQKKITWSRFVDVYYKKRAELYPNSDDRFGAKELISYQRALAEQMDAGKITERQWAYFIDKKDSDIDARNSMTAPRQTICTTTNEGSKTFSEYKTVCR